MKAYIKPADLNSNLNLTTELYETFLRAVSPSYSFLSFELFETLLNRSKLLQLSTLAMAHLANSKYELGLEAYEQAKLEFPSPHSDPTIGKP